MIGKAFRRVLIELAWIGAMIYFPTEAVLADTTDEIARAQSVNQAVADVIDVRTELEQFTLDDLKALRERGFVSWLEVARQQLLVDTLTKQQHATKEFATMLQALRNRTRTALATVDRDQATQHPRTIPPITVSLPGSVRLVAWLETDRMQSNLISRFLMNERSADSNEDDMAAELQRATETMVQAEKRLRVYPQLYSSGQVFKVRRAELQFSLAQAELQLLNVEQNIFHGGHEKLKPLEESLTAVRTTRPTGFDHSEIAEARRCVDSGWHLGLRDATLRVAEAEARAIGELRAAEIALERKSLLLNSVRQLHSKQHASRREFGTAQEQFNEAERLVQQLRNQQITLDESYKKLRPSLAETNSNESIVQGQMPFSEGSRGSVELPDVQSWPSSLLEDPIVVRHLVDLHRHFYETTAQRDSLVLKLTMLKTNRAKLEDIAKLRPSTETRVHPKSSGVNDFEVSLMAGKSRELELLQLDIRFHEARLHAAKEQLELLALEETRFLQQCLCQQAAGKQQIVRHRESDNQAVHMVALNTSPVPHENRRFSYLESQDWEILGRVCELAFSKNDIEIVKFAYQPRTTRPLLNTSRTPAFPPIQFGIGRSFPYWYGATRLNSYYCYGSPQSIYGRVNACLRVGNYWSRCDRSQIRTFSFCDSFRSRNRSVNSRSFPSPARFYQSDSRTDFR